MLKPHLEKASNFQGLFDEMAPYYIKKDWKSRKIDNKKENLFGGMLLCVMI
jgi:hypothetical protein